MNDKPILMTPTMRHRLIVKLKAERFEMSNPARLNMTRRLNVTRVHDHETETTEYGWNRIIGDAIFQFSITRTATMWHCKVKSFRKRDGKAVIEVCHNIKVKR